MGLPPLWFSLPSAFPRLGFTHVFSSTHFCFITFSLSNLSLWKSWLLYITNHPDKERYEVITVLSKPTGTPTLSGTVVVAVRCDNVLDKTPKSSQRRKNTIKYTHRFVTMRDKTCDALARMNDIFLEASFPQSQIRPSSTYTRDSSRQ